MGRLPWKGGDGQEARTRPRRLDVCEEVEKNTLNAMLHDKFHAGCQITLEIFLRPFRKRYANYRVKGVDNFFLSLVRRGLHRGGPRRVSETNKVLGRSNADIRRRVETAVLCNMKLPF